ncbi:MULTISPECIES: hypothetical protein [Cyanophyceae]|uniref:Uncharacterized protein n=1 Tax=Leptolyngbya subtilissima DQ-A4 TaxID=2933933 RepID=A0ABV0K1W4_9CYAN|nr:hypothetical protein [Nodosilinea sp. FACHB-141]MBD2111261.1 hypothetical protein [Nodosilinea sp. FACHB-141]
MPTNTILWGISIFWWERIGKLMQLLGAATIIADIIGPEKIRRFGTSLQSTIAPNILIQFLKQCFDWYAVIFSQTILKEFADGSTRTETKRKNSQLDFLNHVICFLLTVLIMASANLYSFHWVFLIEFVIIYVCLLISVAPILTVLLIIGLTLLGLVINTTLIKPAAWVLEHPSLDRSTKIASLLLLLAGFHFELLAS